MTAFRRVSEEEVFRGWLYTVAKVDLLDPEGQHFERFIVHHPGAVTIVPVHENRDVTLVRQYRASIDRLVLETPAGTRDVQGEPPEETARRELAEEAGLEAATLTLLIGTFNTPGISDQHTSIYLATGLSPCPLDRAGVEERFMTVETISLDDIERLVADGTLVDETTVLGLLLARAHLDRPDNEAQPGDEPTSPGDLSP